MEVASTRDGVFQKQQNLKLEGGVDANGRPSLSHAERLSGLGPHLRVYENGVELESPSVCLLQQKISLVGGEPRRLRDV